MISSTSDVRPYAVATHIWCDQTLLHVALDDGRIISVPLTWFPRLSQATPEQREGWELLGPGTDIAWPGLDEDLSVAGLLKETATPAPGGQVTFAS